jgi:hypothetical protein
MFWKHDAVNGTLRVPLAMLTVVLWSSSPASAQPTPSWNSTDIGDVGIAGSAELNNGVWTVQGSGGDIWGTADAFQFVHHSFYGDGHVTVRVDDLQNTDPFAKAGVMLRTSLDAYAATVILDVKPDGGVEFMERPSAGAQMAFIAGSVVTTPAWLQLEWQGNATGCPPASCTVSAAVSQDGVNWSTIGGINITLPSLLEAGVAVTSHDTTQVNTAHLEGLRFLPGLWSSTDIGDTGLPGNVLLNGNDGVWSIQGAGADIWGTADSFQFVHTSRAGNISEEQQIVRMDDTGPFAKAGLMFRSDLSDNAAHVILDVKPDGGVEFMARLFPGADTIFVGGANAGFPVWLTMQRHDSTVTGKILHNNGTVTIVGTVEIALPDSIEFGLVVTSHDQGRLNTGVMNNPPR